jgi:hypothetical protein
MSFIEYYIIFALTTGIFALIDVFIPVLHEVKNFGITNVLIENPKLSCLVYFCLTTIAAPFIILPVLVPSMNIRFRESMLRIVSEQE